MAIFRTIKKIAPITNRNRPHTASRFMRSGVSSSSSRPCCIRPSPSACCCARRPVGERGLWPVVACLPSLQCAIVQSITTIYLLLHRLHRRVATRNGTDEVDTDVQGANCMNKRPPRQAWQYLIVVFAAFWVIFAVFLILGNIPFYVIMLALTTVALLSALVVALAWAFQNNW